MSRGSVERWFGLVPHGLIVHLDGEVSREIVAAWENGARPSEPEVGELDVEVSAESAGEDDANMNMMDSFGVWWRTQQTNANMAQVLDALADGRSLESASERLANLTLSDGVDDARKAFENHSSYKPSLLDALA